MKPKPTQQRRTAGGVKFAFQWHRRLGWILAPLLAVSASTGALLLWMQPLPAPQFDAHAVRAWSRALDAGLADLARRQPAAQIEFINLPREPGTPVRVHLLVAPGESGWAEIDAASGTAGALQPDSSDARTVLFAMHERFLLDGIGPWALRAVALFGLVLIAMGLRIWWRVRQLPVRSAWRSWHRRIGPVVVLPLAMMMMTGLVLRWPEMAQAVLGGIASEAEVVQAMQRWGALRLPRPYGDVLKAASAALPQAQPTRIYAARDGVVRVRLRAADEWHPIGLNYVYLRADDASVLRIVRSSDQPITVRYLGVVYPLHAGWLPGSPGVAVAFAARVLWTLFALSLAALAVSGAIQRFKGK